MSIPTIQGIAGILTEPTADSAAGKPILKLFIAMNDSRYENGNWVTTKQFTVEAVAWEDLAERLGNVLSKGDQIYIEGRLETQTWEDKNGGGKRSKPALTLRTARKLEKAQSQSNNGGGYSGSNSGSNNGNASGSWGAAASGGGDWGGNSGTDSAPF